MGEMERRVFRDWVPKAKAIILSLHRSPCLGCNVMSLKHGNKGVVFTTVGEPHSAIKCEEEARRLLAKIFPDQHFLYLKKKKKRWEFMKKFSTSCQGPEAS